MTARLSISGGSTIRLKCAVCASNLGEIEAVLAEHSEVRQAAVHLWKVKDNDVRLVACCVPAQAGVLSPIKLRKHLRGRLPDYMVPQYFLAVEELPLTPNGKVDRNRLPTPGVTGEPFPTP